MNIAYATYFDSFYLPRGLALIDSLREVREDRTIVVLALDEYCSNYLMKRELTNVQVIEIEDVIRAYPELSAARKNRSQMEFVFTLTPWLMKWVLEANDAKGFIREIDWVTYLDADLYFFSNPEPIYVELATDSIGIIEHRFTDDQEWRLRFGRFNVGWVSIKSDPNGLECVNWWSESCLKWCLDGVEGENFADQGYLNQFPRRFNGVRIIQAPGANVAPWNLKNHSLVTRRNGAIDVDGQPLIFFHFHGIRERWNRYLIKHLPYRVRTTRLVRNQIYLPYIEVLEKFRNVTSTKASASRKATRFKFSPIGRRFVIDVLTWVVGDSFRKPNPNQKAGKSQ